MATPADPGEEAQIRSLPEIVPEAISEKREADDKRDRESRERAGRQVGVSGRYVQEAKSLAEKAPELMADVKSGKLTLSKAKREDADAVQEQPDDHRADDDAIQEERAGVARSSPAACGDHRRLRLARAMVLLACRRYHHMRIRPIMIPPPACRWRTRPGGRARLGR